jgi:hypothetical protein
MNKQDSGALPNAFSGGFTKRELLAAAFGLVLQTKYVTSDANYIAMRAVAQADALIAELGK